MNQVAAKPYRDRVELVIWKEGNILVTVNESKEGIWYGLPGGGRDHGEPFKHAAVREALEEVGIEVAAITPTHFSSRKEGYRSEVPGRESEYAGSYTRLYDGIYSVMNSSLLNKDGDQVKYEWMKPMKALQLFSEHYLKCGGSGRHAIDYLCHRLRITLPGMVGK